MPFEVNGWTLVNPISKIMNSETTEYLPEEQAKILEEIVEVTRDFPAPPLILTRILELTSQPDVAIEKIEKVLSSDAAMAAKVLKLSNSAFYGRSRNIASIREAIVLLGIHTIRSLVVASGTHSLYSSGAGMRELKEKMWEHSLASAVFSKMLVSRQRNHPPEEAFLAGLLHDIGKLVLLERFPVKYVEILREENLPTLAALQKEQEMFNFTHPQVGAALVNHWLLPENLVEAIGRSRQSGDVEQLSRIATVADAIVSQKGHNLFQVDSRHKRLVAELELEELALHFDEEFTAQQQLFM